MERILHPRQAAKNIRIDSCSIVLVVSNDMATDPLRSLASHGNSFDLIIEPNPENTMVRFVKEAPSLIVIDNNDQKPAILEVIRAHRENSAVPLLFLTKSKSETYLRQAYDAGVDECIIKPISPFLFHAKIKAWLRRSWLVPIYDLDPLKVGCTKLIPSERAVVLDNRNHIHLTGLEVRLLFSLMSRPGKIVSSEELIQRMGGFRKNTDDRYLQYTIQRLRKKIERDPGNPAIIQAIPGVGYRWISEI